MSRIVQIQVRIVLERDDGKTLNMKHSIAVNFCGKSSVGSLDKPRK